MQKRPVAIFSIEILRDDKNFENCRHICTWYKGVLEGERNLSHTCPANTVKDRSGYITSVVCCYYLN